MRRKKSESENSVKPFGSRETPDESVKSGDVNIGRRKLISRLGLGAILVGIGGQAYAFVRSLVPNVLRRRQVHRGQTCLCLSTEKHSALYFGDLHPSGLHRENATLEPTQEGCRAGTGN